MQKTLPDITPEALQDIGRVLAAHGLSERYGVYDVHDHFPVKEGEVMHEINDQLGRVIVRRPVSVGDLPAAARSTAWLVGPDGSTTVDMWCCD
jgi:hypothetical protein